MGRILSYIFVGIVSLLFLTHSNGVKSDAAILSTLQQELYHVDGYPDHKDDIHTISDSSGGDKTFIFCRFGRSPQSAPVLKEKQCFSTGSLTHQVLLAFTCITSLHVFQSYDTHIPDRLKSILYPKHSFW